jgi:hypothetical protein
MRPRQILARRFYLLTRRCLLRMFLLRPDDETNGVYLYCLDERQLLLPVDDNYFCRRRRRADGRVTSKNLLAEAGARRRRLPHFRN